MSSYCRITGKSRGLPKSNYFPLLPPISPADAKRLCRITGKSIGQPSHNYLPVLVKIVCKKKYIGIKEKKLHKILPGYRYLTPCLKSNIAEKLIEILGNKKCDNGSCYVYTVREKQCGLIFTANLEAAVRDGDIEEVMLATDLDSVLLKLNKGTNFSLPVSQVENAEKLQLYEGEGKTKTKVTDCLRKIFEDKDDIGDNDGEKPIRKLGKTKKKRKNREFNNVEEVIFNEDFIKTSIKFDNWLWNDFNVGNYEQIVNKLPTPVHLKPLQVILKDAKPGIVQQPCFTDSVPLDTVAIVAPFKPSITQPEQQIFRQITALSIQQLETTSHIHLLNNNNCILPNIQDIPYVINLLNNYKPVIEEIDHLKIYGVKIDIGGVTKFVIGQTIKNENGENVNFLPGQTVTCSTGEKFVPGIVINNGNDEAKLLAGIIINTEQGKQEFIAGQWTLTSTGEQFVAGQVLKTKTGLKFIPGQTVTVDGKLKFIPGQIYEDRFIPGQILQIDGSLEFVPGQTVSSKNEYNFIPGLSMWSEKGWEFIPGLANKTKSKFIPGRIIPNDEFTDGVTGVFMPGQYARDGSEDNFLPGITIGEHDTKFICGATVETPTGNQFIQGQIVRTTEGKKFIAGTTDNSTGEVIFQAATNLQQLKYEDSNIDNLSKKELYPNGVFGQMVQSSHGVEFFPGEANSCLPKGRVVPGKLIRSSEVKFVPGLMIDGNFVPGQIVITEDCEQFIPGQVIETSEGPKFVPGQIISTKIGDKFIPGQTINTETGPKFIPGQIIETKVGPTFIPGQVIHTENGTPRFVPGEVLETSEGPRFVPGRVVEAGDHVTFIPGQIIQTEQGLRFIAPDLNSVEEDQEFTVQGFEISPEELHLVEPKGCDISGGDLIIDSNMLRQLSEAGMNIGNEISAEIPEVSVRSAPAMSAACTLGQKLKLDPVTTVKVSQIIAAIVKIGKLGEIQGNSEQVHTLNKILERVIHCRTDEEAYKLISNIIEKEFATTIVESVDKLHSYVVSPESPVRKLNKINIMKEILNCKIDNKNNEILKKLVLIMNEEDETALCSALNRIEKVQPEIVNCIIERFMESVGRLESERDVVETLHKSIVASVRQVSEMSIVDLMKHTENLALKTLILEAVSLAKALDMHETAVALLNFLSNTKCTNILAGDRITLEILRKLTVMKKLAEKKPEFLAALKKLNLDPYEARSDPNLIQLAKESQALLVIPEEGTLESSENVPTSLLFSQNSLAMEEYLSRRKRIYRILVIIKNGIQAIIPREAAHSVLTGTVPYAVLDDKGLHYFQPKHVFTALKLPKIATHWFSLYKCEYKEISSNNRLPINTSIITH